MSDETEDLTRTIRECREANMSLIDEAFDLKCKLKAQEELIEKLGSALMNCLIIGDRKNSNEAIEAYEKWNYEAWKKGR